MTENSSSSSSFSRSGLSRTSGNSRAPLWCLWAAEFAGSYAEWNITVALFELPTNPPPGYTLTRDYLSLSIGLLRREPRRRSSRFSKKFVARTFVDTPPLFVPRDRISSFGDIFLSGSRLVERRWLYLLNLFIFLFFQIHLWARNIRIRNLYYLNKRFENSRKEINKRIIKDWILIKFENFVQFFKLKKIVVERC